MKCQGKFKFKGLIKKDGGEFTNNKGQKITYDSSYQIKLDEITEKGIFERNFKISKDSDLVETLLIKKPYTDVTIEFDVNIFGNTVKVVPVAIIE